MTLQELVGRLHGAKKSASGWVAQCPAHEDKNASLSVGEAKDGKLLLHCFAGCSVEAVCDALGIKQADLYPEPPKREPPRRAVAWYTYTDRTGRPLIQVVRYQPKSFGRRSPDGRGGWQWGGTGHVEALYRWPQLLAAAQAHKTIYLVEGERDADNGARVGLDITTALGGASHWVPAYAAEFRGAARVVVIADKDDPGRAHATKAKRDIEAAGVPVVAMVLPDRAGKPVKDLTDWLGAGGTAAELAELVEAAPPWQEVEVESTRPASDSPGRGGERGVPALSAEPPDYWQAKYADMSLRASLADATWEAESAGRRRLDAGTRREIIEVVGVRWLREHGSYYADRDSLYAASSLYYNAITHELMVVGSDLFRSWLSLQTGLPRIGNDYRQLLSAVEDAALAGEHTQRVTPERYWASRPGCVYISNGDGAIARVTADGVTIEDNGVDGVLMTAGRTLPPWKLVDEGEEVDPATLSLFSGMASVRPYSDLLLMLWLLSLPANMATKPPLVICGTVGSGKTRLARGVYELLGLLPRINGVTDSGEEDFWTGINYGGIYTLDNADTRVKWLPDALAAAATDGVRERRKLYTDADIVVQRARAALIITSANPLFATDAGLADRLEIIRLERRVRDTADSALRREIEERRDGCMSWIARTMSRALRVRSEPPAGLNRRHPDWASWCWRCGVALGRQADAEAVLRAAEFDKSLLSVQSDPLVGAVLLDYMARRGSQWEGTASDLSRELLSTGSYDDRARDAIAPVALGRRLARNWPHFEAVFQARRSMLHGVTRYRLDPPTGLLPQSDSDSAEGGGGGDFAAFQPLHETFCQDKGKNTPAPPPPPPDPAPLPADQGTGLDDIGLDYYDPLEGGEQP